EIFEFTVIDLWEQISSPFCSSRRGTTLRRSHQQIIESLLSCRDEAAAELGTFQHRFQSLQLTMREMHCAGTALQWPPSGNGDRDYRTPHGTRDRTPESRSTQPHEDCIAFTVASRRNGESSNLQTRRPCPGVPAIGRSRVDSAS